MNGTPLLDRGDEIAALRRVVQDAAGGRGGVVLLEGPAGIGKSALLDAVVPIAREVGALVLSARASELDRGFAFGIVHQLLEPAVGELDGPGRDRVFAGAAGRAETLFSVGTTPAPADPEFGVLNGLFWLVSNLADEQPVVLRVDDLHWADVGSVRFVEFLARRVDELSIVVVGTVRPNEPGAPTAELLELAGGPAARTLRPDPLGADAVAAVLGGALDAGPDAGFVVAATEATGGNPLLLTILAGRRPATGSAGGLPRCSGSRGSAGGGSLRSSIAGSARSATTLERSRVPSPWPENGPPPRTSPRSPASTSTRPAVRPTR